MTSTEQINQRVRDAISTQGIRVASASSEPQIVNISCQTDGKIAVTAEISTTFTFNYEGYGTSETPGIKSDQHVLTLSVDSSDYSVLEDKITSHEEVATPGDTPPEYDPTISNSDYPEAGQAVESSGTSVGGGTASGTPLILPAYNTVSPDVSAMQQYALKWTSPPYEGDEKNILIQSSAIGTTTVPTSSPRFFTQEAGVTTIGELIHIPQNSGAPTC